MKEKKMHHSMSHSHMKHEKLSHAGYSQGDMDPHVEDYQTPHHDFSQEGFSKTTQYIERQDAFVGRESAKVRKQAYMGRYS